jgi:iron complex transport system ATP-binding protein
MVMDEPTASLDLGHQTGVMDLVRDLQRQREGAIVVAMHDLTLAALYCDRLVMVTDGRVFAQGTPKEILTRDVISEAYGADVQVLSHPEAGNPVVVPVSGNGSAK